MVEVTNIARHHGRSTLAQVLASVAVHTQNINIGVTFGVAVFVIGALRVDTGDLYFTKEQASWFGGMVFLVHPVGGLMYSLIQDTLSRKTFMIVMNVPQFLAYLMMYFATSVYHLLAAQAIIGISFGFLKPPLLSYLGEILEPRVRGTVVSLNGSFLNFGALLATFIGATTHWRTMMLCVSAMPAISFTLLLMIPNSPAWLVLKGRVDDAGKAFQWLRGWVPASEVREELDALVNYVKNKEACSPRLNDESQPIPESKLNLFLQPSVQRPLRLCVIYNFVGLCAGIYGTKSYFKELAPIIGIPISADKALVYLNCVTLLGAMVASLGIRRLGKRRLTFLSMTLTTAASLGLGVYMLLGCHLPWLPLILFGTAYFGGYSGVYVIPWVLISEIFPLRMKSAASGTATALLYLMGFIVIKTFYSIESLLGLSGAFIFYGVVGVLGFIYLYFRLPETEGVPLEDIEKLFMPEKETKQKVVTSELSKLP